MNLYIVGYSTGEYDGYSTYTLAVFVTETEAKAHVTELERLYADWDLPNDDGRANYRTFEYYIDKPYKLDLDYTGPYFYYESIPIGSPILEASLQSTHPELFIQDSL